MNTSKLVAAGVELHPAGESADVRIAPGTKAGDVIRQAAARNAAFRDTEKLELHINGRIADLNTPVNEHDQLYLCLPFAGN